MKRLEEFRFGRRIYDLDIYEPHVGSCDVEPRRRRRITVTDNIDTPQGFDTLIHEVLHAIDGKLTHKQIERIAHYLSKFLLAMGYRRKK